MSETSICNMALSHVGQGEEIANLTTEKSAAASACRRFFDIARDVVLTDFQWPFARSFQTLSLIEENPNDEWGYSYRYPTDCLFIRRILSGNRQDSETTRIPFIIGSDDSGRLIYTDQDSAEIEFTKKITDTNKFPHSFQMALSYRLAMYIAPRLSAGDPFKLQQLLAQFYFQELDSARKTAHSEQTEDIKLDASFVRVRG